MSAFARFKLPAVAASTALILGAGSAAYAAQTDVTLNVDGQTSQVRTYADTVGTLLKNRGVEIGEHDKVTPAPSAAITPGQVISVSIATPVNVTVNGVKEQKWTTAKTYGDLITELGFDPKVVRANQDANQRLSENANLEITTPITVTVRRGDKVQTVQTFAKTVGELLEAKGKELGRQEMDQIEPKLETELKDGQTIIFHVLDEKDVTNKLPIDFKTVRQDDATLAKGETKVKTKGEKGEKTQVVHEVWVDGQLKIKTVKSETVTKQPVDEVVLVGTRTAEASRSEDRQSPNPSASAASSQQPAAKPKVEHVQVSGGQTCQASFYWEGQMTASGERFNPNDMTAAHKTLPLGSRVRVTNPRTGASVVVRINDRGPYVGGRCLDLSRAAFSAIGNTGSGVMTVNYQVLGR